jgi:hypothetical protein
VTEYLFTWLINNFRFKIKTIHPGLTQVNGNSTVVFSGFAVIKVLKKPSQNNNKKMQHNKTPKSHSTLNRDEWRIPGGRFFWDLLTRN